MSSPYPLTSPMRRSNTPDRPRYEKFREDEYFDDESSYQQRKHEHIDQRDDSSYYDNATTYSRGSPAFNRDDDATSVRSYTSRVSEARHSAQKVLEEAARESEEMFQRQQQRKLQFGSPPQGRKKIAQVPLSTRSYKESSLTPKSPVAPQSPSARSESGMQNFQSRALHDSPSYGMDVARHESQKYENDELKDQLSAMQMLLRDKETEWKKNSKNLESKIVELCKEKQTLKSKYEKDYEEKEASNKKTLEDLQKRINDLEYEKQKVQEKSDREILDRDKKISKLDKILKQKDHVIEALQDDKSKLTESAKLVMDEARREIERLKEDHTEETEHVIKSMEFEFSQKIKRLEIHANKVESDIHQKNDTIAGLKDQITKNETTLKESEKKNLDLINEKKGLLDEIQKSRLVLEEARAETDNLKREKSSIQITLDRIKKEQESSSQIIKSLETKATALTKELSTSEAKYQKTLAGQERLEARIAVSDEENSRLSKEYQATRDQLMQAQKELHQVQSEMDLMANDFNAALGKKEREVRNLNESLQFQEEKTFELKADMKNAKQEMENKIRNIEKEMQKKKRELAEESERSLKNENEVLRLRKDMEHIVQDNDALKSEATELRKLLEMNREKLAFAKSLETELKEMEANLSCLKRELVSLNEEKQNLTTEVFEIRRENNSLKVNLDKLERQIEDSRGQIEEDDKKIRRLFEDNDQLHVTNKNLASEVSSLRVSLDRAEKELSSIPELETLLSDSEKDAASLQRECESIRAENLANMREFKAEISDLRRENEALHDRFEAEKVRVARNESLVSEMQHEINQREDMIKELETRVQIEKRSNANLSRDVKELSMQLEEVAEANRLGEEAFRVEARKNERQFEEHDNYAAKLLQEIETYKEDRAKMQREIRMLNDELERVEQQLHDQAGHQYLGSPSARMRRQTFDPPRSVATKDHEYALGEGRRYGSGASVSGTQVGGDSSRRYAGGQSGNRSVAMSSRADWSGVASRLGGGYDAESRQDHRLGADSRQDHRLGADSRQEHNNPQTSTSAYAGGRNTRQFRY